jgi:hypothetical protein
MALYFASSHQADLAKGAGTGNTWLIDIGVSLTMAQDFIGPDYWRKAGLKQGRGPALRQ